MFEDNSRQFIQQLKSANESALNMVATKYKVLLIESMKNTPRRTDRVYYDLKGVAKHRPSKPKHPPAILSGDLVKSIEITNKTMGEVWVHTDVPYALELERGRYTSEPVMEKRPAWRPAVVKNREVLGATFINEFRSEVD